MAINNNDEKEALNALVLITENIQERNYAINAKFFDDLFAAFSPKLQKELVPDYVEASYAGIHLNDVYEEADFLKMIEGFKNRQILHAKYSLKILNDSIKLFEKFSNVVYCNLKQCKTDLPGVIIVGDLHGSFKDLYYLIQKFGIPGKNYRFVFNGDFVDRGPQQCEVLLTLLFAFLLYPSRIFLNRGNHEDISLNMNKNFDPNFKKDTELKFNKYGLAFFNQAQRLFKSLPIATVVENKNDYKCFIVHGGVSDKLDLEYVIGNKFDRLQFGTVTLTGRFDSEKRKAAEQLSDMLWSDPIPKRHLIIDTDLGCYHNKKRGIGCLFGENVSKHFCKKYNFNTIIRSHEVRERGFSQDHPYCCTIFTSSYYCQGTNTAAVLILGQDKNSLDVHEFAALPLNKDAAKKEKINLLLCFKTYLERESRYLLPKFRDADTQNKGWLKLNKWANILADHVSQDHSFIDPKHLITLKDYLCPCDEQYGIAQYEQMFTTKNDQINTQILQLLDDIFSLIDLDHNGSISQLEAAQAIKIINLTLGTKYDTNFITNMDKNKDGHVDFEEFKLGFSNAFTMK